MCPERLLKLFQATTVTVTPLERSHVGARATEDISFRTLSWDGFPQKQTLRKI